MLTASKILKEIEAGNIGIDPFNIDQLNPNSYNVRLDNNLLIYPYSNQMYKPSTDNINKKWITTQCPLDPKNPKTLETKSILIEESGYVLKPGVLYLGSTKEIISSDKYISAIDGRSSIGRLGISIHSTAGFGDIGFSGTYTLEISVIQPVIIYPDMLIGQVYFTEPNGDIDFLYSGRYQNQSGAVESRINIDSKDISNYHYNKNI